MNINNPVKYTDKYVCFLDLLGYKESLKNVDEFEKLISTNSLFNVFKNMSNQNTNLDMQLFSDSIFIAANSSDLSDMLIYISFLSSNLLQNGFLLRGGITFGKLYNENNIFTGPAIVDAYKLENQNAIYPRIIIDEYAHNQMLIDLPSKINRFREDFDGFYFYDILKLFQEDHPTDWEATFIKYKDFTKKSLEKLSNSTNLKLIAKYKWFNNYLKTY